MREIKFRAWDIDLRRMFYKGFYISPDGGVCLFDTEWTSELIAKGFTKDGQHKKKILMQFTGLLDKNGVELFEGDGYTRFNCKRVWVIKRVAGGFVVESHGLKQNILDEYVDNGVILDAEKIGDIFTTPELIGGAK